MDLAFCNLLFAAEIEKPGYVVKNVLPTSRLRELFVRVIWKSRWIFLGGGGIADDWHFNSKSMFVVVGSINSNGLPWWESKKSLRGEEFEGNIADGQAKICEESNYCLVLCSA